MIGNTSHIRTTDSDSTKIRSVRQQKLTVLASLVNNGSVDKTNTNRSADSLHNLVERLLKKQNASAAGGYNSSDFSVEAVSDRIFNFAAAVSGDDKAKLDELKAAIEKGFEKARKAFGGTLPEICNQTHDAIMDKLDKWAASES